MAETYADGIGADRCTHCGAVLRHGGEPMVMIRRTDADTIAVLLSEMISRTRSNLDLSDLAMWTGMLQRLEQAVGRPVRLLDVENGT